MIVDAHSSVNDSAAPVNNPASRNDASNAVSNRETSRLSPGLADA